MTRESGLALAMGLLNYRQRSRQCVSIELAVFSSIYPQPAVV
jgi:hypothetical protein